MKKLGLAMAWLIIIVEYEASSSGTLTALMAVKAGLLATVPCSELPLGALSLCLWVNWRRW